MSCKDNQNLFVLLLYDELSDHEKVGVETHLVECVSCTDAFEAHKTMHDVIAEDASNWDVPSDLLMESRRALADELDRVEQKRSWRQWLRIPAFSVVLTPMRMLESAALVAMGLALGVYVSHQQAPSAPVPGTQTADFTLSSIPPNATISNLRIVSADPATGAVELSGEVVQPLNLRGGRESETVQRLLVSTLREANNPGARLRAAEVLGQKFSDPAVKEALIHAMINDDNAGVRLKAMEGLKPFVRDPDVREAFVQAVRADNVSGIRMEAIEALNEFSMDETMARTIQEATKDDDNPAVRIKGLQFVGNRQ